MKKHTTPFTTRYFRLVFTLSVKTLRAESFVNLLVHLKFVASDSRQKIKLKSAKKPNADFSFEVPQDRHDKVTKEAYKRYYRTERWKLVD